MRALPWVDTWVNSICLNSSSRGSFSKLGCPTPCSGTCQKVKLANGSSCSACCLGSMSLQHVSAWQGGMTRAGQLRAWTWKTISLACVCVFGRLQYFFLIFTSLSLLFPCNCAGFVLVFFSHPFLHLIFSFCCGFIPFFFKLYLLVLLFFPMILIKIHRMCLSFFLYFLSPFLFLSPKLFPFHSIGTREVVTQKNLSGLVPIRDLRLDPSLLCSIPLLALSPNLLIVWLFLSIAYLVTKLRCKWVSLWKINKSQENKSARIYLTGQKECVKAWLPRNISCLTVWRFVVLNYKYLPNYFTKRTCSFKL